MHISNLKPVMISACMLALSVSLGNAGTVNLSYDQQGHLVTIEDANNRHTAFVYDHALNFLSVSENEPDADADGLTDTLEAQLGTQQLVGDSDGDGLADGYEVSIGLDPLVNEELVDSDNDGLKNIEEYRYGTNPFSADSDSDGLTDFEEVTDNLPETNPLQHDTDGDGMPDGWEVAHGLDLNSNDAALDKDGDGVSNLAEFKGRSDPTDPSSRPLSNLTPIIQLLLLN